MRTLRYENKYVVSGSLSRRIRAAITPFVEPDQFAARCLDYAYPVASLYLDTVDRRLYRETLEGRRNRFKLRIRSYTDDDKADLFLEVKRRIANVVQKSRCPLPRRRAEGLLRGGAGMLSGLDGDRHWAGAEFLGLSERINALPQIIVRYDREAYMGRFDPEFRATFDRRLRTVPAGRMEVAIGRKDYRFVSGSLVVVEFKFNYRIPGWLPGIIRRFDLKRRSFSKYANSVKAAGNFPAAFFS